MFQLKDCLISQSDLFFWVYQLKEIFVLLSALHFQQLLQIFEQTLQNNIDSDIKVILMGVCPSLTPQARVLNKKNQELLIFFNKNLTQLTLYGFSKPISLCLKTIQPRYLFTEAILQDNQRILNISKQGVMRRSSYESEMNFQEQIKNSCIILQNEESQPLNSQNQIPSDVNIKDSFKNNLMKNQSLVVQINILYSKQINKTDYSDSLYLFLKWAQLFQEHSYGGFLKPIYKEFCKYIYNIPKEDFSTVVDQTSIFVQLLVTLVTHVYELEKIVSSESGKLIKNENVYNLIMSFLFKKTRIKNFIISCIKNNELNKIELFRKQINKFKMKTTSFFEIGKKFRLKQSQRTESQINNSIQGHQDLEHPYSKSLKYLNELCGNGSPITKLKIIVHISKQILVQIRQYYKEKKQQGPDLDPDNLSSIVMYLIVKNGNPQIYQELKIVQYFTTTNCLNCISGYYLNVFAAAIESILELTEP